jgi:hypothetical protein
MLKIVNDKMDDRLWLPFRVTVGLIEGYDATAKRHTLDEVKHIIGKWLVSCKCNGLPELPGMVSEKTMLYTRRNNGELLEEPVVVFEGEVNPLRVSEETKEERLILALWALAEMFVFEFNQKRVYLKLDDHMIVLEDQRE